MENSENNERIPLICHNFNINSVLFTDNNKSFLTTEKGPNELDYYIIQQFDITTKRRQLIMPSPRQEIYGNDYHFPTAVSNDGLLFAIDGYDYNIEKKTVLIYNTLESSLKTTLYCNNSSITQLIFSGDNNFLYTSSLDSCIRKWDLNTGTVIDSSLFDKDIQYFAVNESSGEYYLVLGEYDKINSVSAYNYNSKELIKVFELKFNFTIFDKPYAFSPDNRYFATNIAYGSKVNKIAVLDMMLRDTIAMIETPDVYRLIFTNDGKGLVTFSKETNELELWDIENMRKFPYISDYIHIKANRHKDNLDPPLVTAMSFSPDGRYFAFGNDEPAVLIYDTQTLDVIDENNNDRIDNSNVFPNPVKSHTEIRLVDFYAAMPSLTIYNIYGGRQDAQAEFISAGNTQKLVLNNLNLTPGFYIYTVTGDSRSQSGSFVVVN